MCVVVVVVVCVCVYVCVAYLASGPIKQILDDFYDK